jgi:hypothetical protein
MEETRLGSSCTCPEQLPQMGGEAEKRGQDAGERRRQIVTNI